MAQSVNTSSYVALSVKERVGYGFGDLASNLSFGMTSLFLLYFYTNIYGISGAQASLIFVISRVVDAIFNIVIGYFIDKTNTKYGKLRPYLLFGAIPLGILTVLCFTSFDTDIKFYYALISYTIYCLAYTAVNTPYSAMTNMMTQNETARSSLSMYRLFFAMVGYFIVSTSAEKLIRLFTEPKAGYIFAVSCFALLATFFFLACFGMTKERVVPEENAQRPTLKEMARAIYVNPPLLHLSAFTIFVYIAYSLWNAMAVYYIMYVIKDNSFIATFFAVQAIIYTLGTLLSEKLIGFFGKKKLTALMLPLGAIALSAQYFFFPNSKLFIMLCVAIYSISLSIIFVCMWAMIADTVEYAEWKTHVRAEGAIYGFYNFITKVAMAIAGGIAGLLLEFSGYDANLITEKAVHWISLSMTLLPAALFIAGLVFISMYLLDEKHYLDIIKQIEARKNQ